MPYCENMAEILRADLGAEPGLSERKMFGGLSFLLHGHMACRVLQDRCVFRVGKARESHALSIGAGHIGPKDRPMRGIFELDKGAFFQAAVRHKLTEIAFSHASSLPLRNLGS